MTDLTPPDNFAALAGLLALVTDAKGCAKRLDELQKLTDQAVKAQNKLGAERDAIAADREALAAIKAALDERAAKLAQREGAARILENNLHERAQKLAASLPERYPPDPNFFGTIRQEPH